MCVCVYSMYIKIDQADGLRASSRRYIKEDEDEDDRDMHGEGFYPAAKSISHLPAPLFRRKEEKKSDSIDGSLSPAAWVLSATSPCIKPCKLSLPGQ